MIQKQYTQSGHWYQPYIHSVPENFLEARNRYYQGWNLDSAIAKAKIIAKKLFKSLEGYYLDQEKTLAAFLDISHDELKNNVGYFLNNLSDIYEGKVKGGEYGFMSNFSTVLEESKKIEDSAIDNDYVATVIRNWMLKEVKKIKPDGAEAVVRERIKEVYSFVNMMGSVVDNLIENKKIKDPNQLGKDVVLKLLLGQPLPAGLGAEGNKIISTLNKTNQELVSFLKKMKTGVSPITSPKSKKEVPKIKTQSVQQQMATQLGVFNEDLIKSILNSMSLSGSGSVTEAFMGRLRKNKSIDKADAQRVGSISKVQVQDVTWTLTNKKGKTFNIGFDLKFTSKSAALEYNRGPNVKMFSEVIDLINNPVLSSQMMYLLVNSYYQQGYSEAGTTYGDLLGSNGKKQIFELINVIRGLYGLLPASAVDFTTIDRIENFVKQDNRMFVMINNNIMLMTDFLGQVKEQVLSFQGAPDTITKLRPKFKQILDTWNTEHGIKKGANRKGENTISNKGSLYINKIQLIGYLKFAGYAAYGSTAVSKGDAYKDLKKYVDTNVTRSTLKDDWKFTVDNTVFTFKPGKQ